MSCLHKENLVFLTFSSFATVTKFSPASGNTPFFWKKNPTNHDSRGNTQNPSKSRQIESELDRQFPEVYDCLFGNYCLGCHITNGEGLKILIDFSTSVGVLWHRCVVRQRVFYLVYKKRSATTDMSSSWALLTVLYCLWSSCLNVCLSQQFSRCPL